MIREETKLARYLFPKSPRPIALWEHLKTHEAYHQINGHTKLLWVAPNVRRIDIFAFPVSNVVENPLSTMACRNSFLGIEWTYNKEIVAEPIRYKPVGHYVYIEGLELAHMGMSYYIACCYDPIHDIIYVNGRYFDFDGGAA